MASALFILILPEGTELVYVGVLLEMPAGAEGAAVLVQYCTGTLAGVLCRCMCSAHFGTFHRGKMCALALKHHSRRYFYLCATASPQKYCQAVMEEHG